MALFTSLFWFSWFLVLDPVFLQLISPCPRIFQYEQRPNEPDRWYGTATVTSDQDLAGVWFRVILDSSSIQLGNWFGEVERRDNQLGYIIKNPNYELKGKVPLQIKFYVRYNPNDPPPKLVSFRLNAVVKCPENGGSTEAPLGTGQLFTNKPEVADPLASSQGGISSTNLNFGSSGLRPGSNSESDDFFHGDYVELLKPQGTKPNILEGATCGTVIKSPRPLITHGQATQEGEFPWHAALYHSQGIDLTYICGASLISLHHLITVAHCVTRKKSQTTVNPDNLVVYLGKFYLRVWKTSGLQDRRVDKIIIHSKYNPQSFGNDIAILKFTDPAKLTNYVRPICLWEGAIQLETVVNQLGTVVGWGFDETGKVTEQLTKAHMPIVSQETCIYSFPDFYSRFTSSSTFCAGFKNADRVITAMLLSTCLVWALGFFFVDCVLSQELVSPCPRIFKYERNASEPDRWYGTATVSSDQDLIGVWFRVILDSKSLQLGNWFGEVETRDDDLGYIIKSPNFRLKARKVLKIKFFVRYNPNEPPPKLASFRLNAVVKCPEVDESTESALASGQLYTNKPRIANQFSNSSGLEISDKPSTVDSTTCGTVVEPPTPLTSQFVNEGKFPWHATLYHSQQIDLTYVCGASLIGSQYVVTAAHCVTKKKSTAPVNAENLVAYLGKAYLQNWKTPGIQDKRIEQIIVHPKYNPQSLENNIAVLKLTEPVELTHYVRPICLWEAPTQSNILTDQTGSIVGWGLDENGKVTGQLINAQLSIVSQETCNSSTSEIYSKVPSDSIFCAGFENGTSVCNGDSGSGLMLLRPGSNQNPVWQIRGLVSVSAALQNRVTCASSHYVVFTDIAKYLDFVKESMNL